MNTDRTKKPKHLKTLGLSAEARMQDCPKTKAKGRNTKSPFLCGGNVIVQPLPPTIENWESCEWIARLVGANRQNNK